jgi:hypothetical protein
MTMRIALLLLLVVGCKGKGGPVEQVVAAWRGAGVTLPPFRTLDPQPFNAQACSQGEIQGVEAIVCAYPDAQASERAEQQQRARFAMGSSTTALTVRKGAALITLTDPAHSDPNGRMIARLVSSLKSL